MLRVDIEVIVVNGERLRAFGNARHKLLHLKKDVALLSDIKLLHRNVGGRNTIYTQEQDTERPNKQSADDAISLVWAEPAFVSSADPESGLTRQIRGYIVDGNIQIS